MVKMAVVVNKMKSENNELLVAFCNSLRIDPDRSRSFRFVLLFTRSDSFRVLFHRNVFVESIWIALARSGSDVRAKVSSAHIRHMFTSLNAPRWVDWKTRTFCFLFIRSFYYSTQFKQIKLFLFILLL